MKGIALGRTTSKALILYRISAFDVVLPRAIPFKGQILNQIAEKFLKMTEDIVPNWIEKIPDPNVTIGKSCKTYPVEMVIRGYLTGHACPVRYPLITISTG